MAQEAGPDGNIFECRSVSLELPHLGGRRLILDRIGIELRRGEFLTIVGASGTGKSTLLRILGGLVAASSGSVTFGAWPATFGCAACSRRSRSTSRVSRAS